MTCVYSLLLIAHCTGWAKDPVSRRRRQDGSLAALRASVEETGSKRWCLHCDWRKLRWWSPAHFCRINKQQMTAIHCINERVFSLIYESMPQFCAAVNCSNLNN